MTTPSDPAPAPPAPRCAACEYDLRGACAPAPGAGAGAAARCPECGELVGGPAAALARERVFFQRLRRRLIALFVVTAALGVAAIALFHDHALFLTPLLVFLVAPAAPVLVAAYCTRRLGA
jgi:hypothetical protein